MKLVFLAATRLMPALLVGTAVASSAQAESTSCEMVDQDLDQLLPPAYLSARQSAVSLPSAFDNDADGNNCQNGWRVGSELAKTFVRQMAPSCNDLLNPLGDEWVAPAVGSSSVTRFRQCFNQAWSSQVSRRIYDVARSCAANLLSSSQGASEAAYHDCYTEVANYVVTSHSQYVSNPGASDERRLVPRDATSWENLNTSLASLYDHNSGMVKMACDIGKADAESGLAPRTMLNSCGPSKPSLPSPNQKGGSRQASVPASTYMFVAAISGKCLNLEVKDLYHSGYNDYAPVHQWGCPGQDSQWNNNYWHLEIQANGSFALRSEYSGKCLAAPTAVNKDGDNTFQVPCDDHAQVVQATFDRTSDPNSYTIRDLRSGRCLTIDRRTDMRGDGNALRLNDCDQASDGSQTFALRQAHAGNH